MSSEELHDAMLWTPEGDAIRCQLCAHNCLIADGKRGVCMVRQNVGGVLKTLNYNSLIAMNVDPIEKKPLFHFLPGTFSMSIATPGCNFQCSFCQNWQISQSPRDGNLGGQAVAPQQIVAAARQYNCQSISYTYTEPTIFFELAYDTCVLARQAGLKNCFVTNGFMSTQAIEKIAPYLDAANVDLKAFSDDTYRRVMKGRLDPVLQSLQTMVRLGIWVEVTTLVVPGMNDSPEELRSIAEFIAGKLGVDVPWHISRFHADYKMQDVPPTPATTLADAHRIGLEAGLQYVYCGNAPGEFDEYTRCRSCGTMLIERRGFHVGKVAVGNGACPSCGHKICGVWK